MSALRYFCGFCGTPLGYWTETPRERRDVIDVTLGTLSSGDLKALEEWGLVGENVTDADGAGNVILGGEVEEELEKEDGEGHSGLSWFNEMVEGSRLGKTRKTREKREGPGWRVEWEIMEWIEGDDEPSADTSSSGNGGAGAKRKIGQVENDDISMQG